MAPRKRPWFRFYVEAVHDRKLRRLKPETRWLFVACLAAARQSSRPGWLLVGEDDPMDESDLADFAGMDIRSVRSGMTALLDAGVILCVSSSEVGPIFSVAAWESRQYESDDSTPRSRLSRGNVSDATAYRRCINGDTTADATPPENREQKTDTEGGDKSRSGTCERVPAHHDLLRPDAAPPLLQEADDLVAVLVHAHGAEVVDAAVRQLLDDRLRFPFPSNLRAALETILGSKPSPLDAAAAAQRALMERNGLRAVGSFRCERCGDVGVVERDDGTAEECECKWKASA